MTRADSVELTGEAQSLQRLERELASQDPVDTARVAEVRSALAAGTFNIDANLIATRLVDLERMLDGR